MGDEPRLGAPAAALRQLKAKGGVGDEGELKRRVTERSLVILGPFSEKRAPQVAYGEVAVTQDGDGWNGNGSSGSVCAGSSARCR